MKITNATTAVFAGNFPGVRVQVETATGVTWLGNPPISNGVHL